MPKYAVVYFEARGRGEFIRQVFVAAGVEFEDRRLNKEQWAEFKPKTPYQQLPVLIVDDKTQIAQSKAAARYVAVNHGMAGDTPLDSARCDEIVDYLDDIMKEMVKIFMCKEEDEKKKLIGELQNEKLPEFLKNYERQALATGFFVANKISWADIFFYNTMEFIKMIGVTADYSSKPNLAKLVQNVEKNERIAKWVKNRPQSER